jgi:ketosteroid isomerase-like protein
VLEEADFALGDELDEEEEEEEEWVEEEGAPVVQAARRKRKAISKAEKVAARAAKVAALERDIQQGAVKSFQEQSKVNPVLAWIASVPTQDAVQERKKALEQAYHFGG